MNDVEMEQGNAVDIPQSIKEERQQEIDIAKEKQAIKNMTGDRTDVREIAFKDYAYGLSIEDISLYADKKKMSTDCIKMLSRALKVNGGRALTMFLADSSLNCSQMEIVISFYEKGISLEKIKEVLKIEQTPYSLNQALQNLYETLFVTKAKNVNESEEMQALQKKLESVVEDIAENKKHVDEVMDVIKQLDHLPDMEAMQECYEKQLQEKNLEIHHLKEMNTKLVRDNATLNSKVESVILMKEQNEKERFQFDEKKSDYEEQIASLQQEKKKLQAELEKVRGEREDMKRQIDELDMEMQGVKEQLEMAKGKDEPASGITERKATAVPLTDYQTVARTVNGKSTVIVERTGKKSPEGLLAMAGKMFKGRYRGTLLKTMADAGLDNAQMDQAMRGLKEGLNDEELIHIIQCGFDAEQMEKAIDIVLLEKSYQ